MASALFIGPAVCSPGIEVFWLTMGWLYTRLGGMYQEKLVIVSCSFQKRKSVCDQKRKVPRTEPKSFIAARISERNGFIALELIPAGACRAQRRAPDRSYYQT